MSVSREIRRLLPVITAIATVGCIAFIQFYGLGELPIVQWDESRLAVNAAEMTGHGFSAITTFENTPDLYNTKPPLMIWLQTACMHLFGISEFSVRLPAALAGMACILYCGYLVYRYSNHVYWGCFSAILLAASDGFIQLHGSMTGDYDALLCAFLLPATAHLYTYQSTKNKTALTYAAVWMSLAVMSKSAAAVITFPVFVLAALMHNPRQTLLPTLMALFAALLPFSLFCTIRELLEPGYLKAIVYNDFLGRYTGVIDGHTSEWHYYIVNLFTFRFSFLIWLLPPAMLYGVFKKDSTLRFYSIYLLMHLMLLSFAGTRIHWYDMPLLPICSIAITLFLNRLWTMNQPRLLKLATAALAWFCLMAVLVNKIQFVTDHTGLKLDKGHLELSRMLRAHEGPDTGYYLAAPYDAEFYFYTLSNPSIKRGQYKTLKTGNVVMYGNRYKDSLHLRYRYTCIDSTENAFKIRILGNKNP